MARQRLNHVALRPAGLDDVAAIVALRADADIYRGRPARLRRPATSGKRTPVSEREKAEQRLALALDDPQSLVLVAVSDEDVVGFVWMHSGHDDALSGDIAIHIDYLVVARSVRRHGVGMQLLDAAISFAEQQEADSFVIWAVPGDREANRYLARLGFAPLAIRRGASLSVVRRRLAQAEHGGAGRTKRATSAIPALRRPGHSRLEV